MSRLELSRCDINEADVKPFIQVLAVRNGFCQFDRAGLASRRIATREHLLWRAAADAHWHRDQSGTFLIPHDVTQLRRASRACIV